MKWFTSGITVVHIFLESSGIPSLSSAEIHLYGIETNCTVV